MPREVRPSDSVWWFEVGGAFCKWGCMSRAWLSAVVLAAFFLRDLRLLTSAGSGRIVAACALYPLFFGSYMAALTLWLTRTHARRPDLIAINEMALVWIVAIHAVLCGLTWLISRSGPPNRAWLMALAPSPAVFLCLCLLAGALPADMANSLGILSLLLFGVTWNLLIVPFAFELVRGPFRDRFVSKFPMRFVALLNLFCFLSPGLFLALGGALP